MIQEKASPIMWALARPLGNHLWQSTLFAVAAGLLVLVLRKNSARVRYWLWMTASMKFLIPFSLLVDIGGRLAWMRHSVRTTVGLYLTAEEFAQPFAQHTGSSLSGVRFLPPSSNVLHFVPTILATVWFGGLIMVLAVWYVRW